MNSTKKHNKAKHVVQDLATLGPCWRRYVLLEYNVIEIEHPESDKILKACCVIDEISETFEALAILEGKELQQLYEIIRQKLGMLGLFADEILTETKRVQANRNVMLLYKVLTGQIAVTENDFTKIRELLDQLSHECFGCWCI